MCVAIPATPHLAIGDTMQVRTDPDAEGFEWARIANVSTPTGLPRQVRLGLEVLPSQPGARAEVHDANEVLRRLGGLARVEVPALEPVDARRVQFADRSGKRIVGVLDHVGELDGAPTILIPSAWGKTKESLLPLSMAILATFEHAGLPVAVIRFDGVQKRGESHNDVESDDPRLQNLHYTFSQGAEDIHAAARFAASAYCTPRCVIVSFSIASVEARRALAIGENAAFAGWVSVVGAVDPQSLMRIIAGGIDYFGGAERGETFGRREVQGLELDIDHAARTALRDRIAFHDDARRDFSAIKCPITWIGGSNDAWTSTERALDALSFGTQSNRRIIVSETGHQLRTSDAASETFGIVASECARFLHGRPGLRPVAPSRTSVRARMKAELRRRNEPLTAHTVKTFWNDYLLGRQNQFGMRLVAETSDYRDLMRTQVAALPLRSRDRVVDLGCGLSTFAETLSEQGGAIEDVSVVGIDYVIDALRGARSVVDPARDMIRPQLAAADLDLSESRSIPFGDASFDHAIASLLLNYLRDPVRFLREVHRILRPRGVLVLSALRSDADTSKICVSGIDELRRGRAVEAFGAHSAATVEHSLHGFINDAARILEFEEQGVFEFSDVETLASQLTSAGFRVETIDEAFGDPPQAWLARASKSPPG